MDLWIEGMGGLYYTPYLYIFPRTFYVVNGHGGGRDSREVLGDSVSALRNPPREEGCVGTGLLISLAIS